MGGAAAWCHRCRSTLVHAACQVADAHNAYVLGDIAHIAGLMSAKLIPSAFDHCDIVTTTTVPTRSGGLLLQHGSLACSLYLP